MAGFQELIDFIINGEPVNAGVANRGPRALDGNVRYLRDVLAASIKGEALIAFCKTVDPALQEGQAVFFNPDTLQYEQGFAQTEVDELTGFLVTARSAQTWGIVLRKVTANQADILLGGVAEVNLTQAVVGAVELGKVYYLSGTAPGKMIPQRPPVGVPVMTVGQQGVDPLKYEVFVNPQFTDFLGDHTHVKFDLVALPAGDHSPPALGIAHAITSPDSDTEGWLPVSDAVFEGNAPAGARFGYNLSASKLANVWPPTPVQSASLEIYRQSVFEDVKSLSADFLHDFPNVGSHGEELQAFAFIGARDGDQVLVTPSIAPPADIIFSAWVDSADSITIRASNTSPGSANPALTTFHVTVLKGAEEDVGTRLPTYGRVPDTICIINADGIWWMTDCYNEVPWATNLDTLNPTSESTSLSCPAQSLLVDSVLLSLWYTNINFFTSSGAVLSLRGREGSGLSVYCRNTTDLKEAGHLEIDLDLSLLVNSGTKTGHLVFKNYNAVTKTFERGPVAESIKSASPELILTSDQPAVGGKYYGNVILTANLALGGSEFPVETVRLDGVEEEFYEEVLGLGFPSGRASEFRGRLKIPTRIALPSGTTMKFRFWVQGRIAGTLGSAIFPLSYRILSRPTAVLTDPVALPLADTALTMLTTATYDNADEYVEMESAEFVVNTGDEILFTMSRAASDGYGDKLILLRQEGVLVTP